MLDTTRAASESSPGPALLAAAWAGRCRRPMRNRIKEARTPTQSNGPKLAAATVRKPETAQ
jgi:hypothetical protein